MDLGISILEGVYVPLLQREHYKYTQLSLATRNMTPKTLVTAPNILPEELDSLRIQIDQSYLDPDYAIVTNFECEWQQLGAGDRLLDLSREYETIENHIFAAFGIPREVMTGEGMYSGSKISVEILNTVLMQERDVIKDYVERKLFDPICEAHGWFEYDRNNKKKYYTPSISFNRLTIRDNAEIFDSLFTLYQKGALNIDVIYELLNLNGDEITKHLKDDLFTVKDANFNELIRDANMEVGRNLASDSDVTQRVANYLGFNYTKPPADDGSGGPGGPPGGPDAGGMPGMPGGDEGGMPGGTPGGDESAMPSPSMGMGDLEGYGSPSGQGGVDQQFAGDEEQEEPSAENGYGGLIPSIEGMDASQETAPPEQSQQAEQQPTQAHPEQQGPDGGMDFSVGDDEPQSTLPDGQEALDVELDDSTPGPQKPPLPKLPSPGQPPPEVPSRPQPQYGATGVPHNKPAQQAPRPAAPAQPARPMPQQPRPVSLSDEQIDKLAETIVSGIAVPVDDATGGEIVDKTIP
jgi:hypothetical protein